MKKRYSEEQIIYALKRIEAGSKGLVADLTLDKHILQEVVRKKL